MSVDGSNNRKRNARVISFRKRTTLDKDSVESAEINPANRGDVWLVDTHIGGVYKFNDEAFEKWRHRLPRDRGLRGGDWPR